MKRSKTNAVSLPRLCITASGDPRLPQRREKLRGTTNAQVSKQRNSFVVSLARVRSLSLYLSIYLSIYLFSPSLLLPPSLSFCFAVSLIMDAADYVYKQEMGETPAFGAGLCCT